jgi:hypothetical protein
VPQGSGMYYMIYVIVFEILGGESGERCSDVALGFFAQAPSENATSMLHRCYIVGVFLHISGAVAMQTWGRVLCYIAAAVEGCKQQTVDVASM